MFNQELVNSWNQAAHLIENDEMRRLRYLKCVRYFENSSLDIKILDVGCGEGSGLLFIEKMGFKNLYGIEISDSRLTSAESKLGENVKLFHIDASSPMLPFPDNFFDVVLTAGVIEHVEDLGVFLNNLARVAKKNGIIVISSDCWQWRILQMLGLYKSVQPIDKAIFPLKFFKLFKLSGLNLLHYEGFSGVSSDLKYRFIKTLLYSIKFGINKLFRKMFLTKYWAKKFKEKFIKNKNNVKKINKVMQVSPVELSVDIEKKYTLLGQQSFLTKLIGFQKLLFADENVFLLQKNKIL